MGIVQLRRAKVLPHLDRRSKITKIIRPLILILAITGCAAISPTLPPGDIAAFEARLEKLRRDNSIPGMAAIVARGDRVVWQKGFGFADAESQIPVTVETSFHLASLTKPFAAVVLMRLVEEGKVSLDDPVSRYGITLPSSGTIRVRHLLTHTSEGEPGSFFKYNGDRFSLLDRVILSASGQSFGNLVVQQVILPLGLGKTAPNVLSATNFRLTSYDESSFRANLAQGYTSDGRARQDYPASFSSAAGMISSVGDMVTFSRALDAGTLVSAATWQAMVTPGTNLAGERLPYAAGWFVQDTRGVRVLWHYGYWTANSSLIIKVPSDELTFVLLANSDMLSRPYGLGADDNVSRSPYAQAFLEVFVSSQ
jgi:CubicO group peptidase (beta-lactamase class C family)